MILVQRYYGNEAAYPRYDNYDAIEVSKTQDIPFDYDGAMGVPITELYPNIWTGKLKIISQLARSIHETHPPTDIYSGI